MEEWREWREEREERGEWREERGERRERGEQRERGGGERGAEGRERGAEEGERSGQWEEWREIVEMEGEWNMARGGCDMVCVGCTVRGCHWFTQHLLWLVPRGWDSLSRQGHLSKHALLPR